MIITVRSSKTLQYYERLLRIPVFAIPGSPLCAVSLLREHFNNFPKDNDDFLLFKHSPKGPLPIFYRDVLGFLKHSVSLIGLDPHDVGLHSLRRSGTTFPHSLRIPLEDIKCVGDWKSLAVLSYLITPMETKITIESTVAEALGAIR